MSLLRPSHVAIAVPCFNERLRLKPLLQSLAMLEPAPGALLFLDDGSTDGTGKWLEDQGVDLRTHPQNRGLGAARNSLWRRAEHLGLDLVAFVDADVSLPVDYVARVLAGFKTDPGAAGLGGQNLDLDATGLPDRWRGRFWSQSLGADSLHDAPMLVGACATYRVDALQAVGGFDEDFRTHGEDVDIGRRLRRAGFRLFYDPTLIVEHRREDSIVGLLRACYLHCREGMRATQATPIEPGEVRSLAWGMTKKLVRSPAAAILKRQSLPEAALGIAACGAGLTGYLVGSIQSTTPLRTASPLQNQGEPAP